MIRIEDNSLEFFSVSDKSDIAVPITITSENGNLDILCYSMVKNICIFYESNYSSDPFSRKALSYLNESVAIKMQQYNKKPRIDNEVILSFFSGKNNIDTFSNKILKNTHIKFPSELTENEIIDLKSLNDQQNFIQFNDYGIAITSYGNRIVSASLVNDFCSSEKSIEISVNTLSGFRGMGFGTSSVACLSSYLANNDMGIYYQCYFSNKPSIRIANKLNYSLRSKSYSVVCYSDTNKE